MTPEEFEAGFVEVAKDPVTRHGAAFGLKIAAVSLRKLKGSPTADEDLERLALAFEESARGLMAIR